MKNNPSLYRQAIKSSWGLIWRNISLWILGLLSLLFAGSIGLTNFLSQILVTMGADEKLSWVYYWPFKGLDFFNLSNIFWVFLLIVLALTFFAAVVYISINAKASLLLAIVDFYKKKTTPKLTEIWNKGVKSFWTLLSVEVIKKIALVIVVIIFGIIWWAFPYDKNNFYFIISIIALILTVLAGLFIVTISIFAAGYAVCDKKKLLPAYKKSLKLFSKNILTSFEVSVLLTFFDILLIVAFTILLSFSSAPAVLIWITAGLLGSQALALFGVAFGLILILLAIVIFGSIYNTFYLGVWMFLFVKMNKQNIFSRIKNYFFDLFGKN